MKKLPKCWISIKKNNPEEQGIYKVIMNDKYKGEAVFYPPKCGGRYETNGTWYGSVTHWKKNPSKKPN